MRKVEIPYSTRFLRRDRLKTIDVPERWEDLHPHQYEACAMIHINPTTDENFVASFYQLPKWLVAKLTKFELYKLTELTGFAVKPNGSTNFFYLEEIPGTSLLSPTNRLGNVTMEHFALFDTFYFQYINDATEDKLIKFVSALYLKKKEKITEIDIEKRMKYISKNVDKYTLYAIFMNYMFLRKWLSKSFTDLFDDAEADETRPSRRKYVKPAPVKKGNNLPDWVSIIDGMVGEDVLKYDEYTQMPCIRAFKLIDKRIKNYRKNVR